MRKWKLAFKNLRLNKGDKRLLIAIVWFNAVVICAYLQDWLATVACISCLWYAIDEYDDAKMKEQ